MRHTNLLYHVALFSQILFREHFECRASINLRPCGKDINGVFSSSAEFPLSTSLHYDDILKERVLIGGFVCTLKH